MEPSEATTEDNGNNRLTEHEVRSRIFQCQKKVGVVYENIRSIAQRDFGEPFSTDMEVSVCCLYEAKDNLRDVFETLNDALKYASWSET
jgi:hypothetical protein